MPAIRRRVSLSEEKTDSPVDRLFLWRHAAVASDWEMKLSGVPSRIAVYERKFRFGPPLFQRNGLYFLTYKDPGDAMVDYALCNESKPFMGKIGSALLRLMSRATSGIDPRPRQSSNYLEVVVQRKALAHHARSKDFGFSPNQSDGISAIDSIADRADTLFVAAFEAVGEKHVHFFVPLKSGSLGSSASLVPDRALECCKLTLEVDKSKNFP